MCPRSFFFVKKLFCGTGPEEVPKVWYFRKFSTNFKKQGLKWKLITSPYLQNFFFNFEIFTKKSFFFSNLFWKVLFSGNIYVWFLYKWCLKWKFILPSILFSQKVLESIKKIEKAYVEIFINYKTYYFSLKTKQLKAFSRDEHKSKIFKFREYAFFFIVKIASTER